MTRRGFLKKAVLPSSLLLASSITSGCVSEKFFRQHFKQMSKEQIDGLIQQEERRYQEQFHQKVDLAGSPALPGTLFSLALDLSKCIGCRKCVYACVKENNQSRDPQITWIDVLEMKSGSRLPEEGNKYYQREVVPADNHYYLPIQCQHCQEPPCVKVCPVKATWKEPDGLVVIDYNWCIGCRYCVAACPYEARKVNWSPPSLPDQELNPHLHYLGNRPREKGEVEKCTFCIQRVRKGRLPACVEECPTGARKFGNLLDPESVIRKILAEKDVFILKPELNTQPRFYYYFG